MKSPKPVQPKSKRAFAIVPITTLEKLLSTRRGIMPGRVERNPRAYKRNAKWGQDY